jgi:glycosyltransferase involved in cell wall biosynthesis
MKWMHRQALDRASLVVCDSEPLADLVAHRCEKTLIAQQGTDRSVFRPMDKVQCRIELGLNLSETLLTYIGGINHRFDRDAVIYALDELGKAGLDARLVVAGPNLDSVIAAHPRISYLGKLPQSEIPKVIASADVCLIPYTSTALADSCNPCKLSEYIACKRPIVSSAVSNISDYLPKSGHLCYPPGDGEKLMISIRDQIRNPVLEDLESALTWGFLGDKYLLELDQIKEINVC